MKDSRNRPIKRRVQGEDELPPKAIDRSDEEWTDEDEELLRTHYRKRGARYVARLLGRTESAVRNHAYRRGISGPPRAEWTTFEDRYVSKNYPRKTVASIAHTLGRSPQAVRARLRHHGLTRPLAPKWMPIEVAYLRENYGRTTVREIAEELGRSEDSISLKAARLGIRALTRHVEPTRRQVRYIVKNLGEIPFTTMARTIGTTVGVVRRIALENGFRARPLSRAWTAADEALLRKLWGTMAPAEVARRLNRHESGVAARALTLGLRRRRPR